jgi:hypothetical protein
MGKDADTTKAGPAAGGVGKPPVGAVEDASILIVGSTNVVVAEAMFAWRTGPSFPGLLMRIETLILIGRYCDTPG